jgi:hypothetical protein
MMRSAPASFQRSQFDDFLFTPIGCEANGMSLTVLSALARADVDPWGEAAGLAQMSRESATARATSLIARLPERPSSRLEPEATAARLIALLPSQAHSAPAPGKGALRTIAASYAGPFILPALMAFLLGARSLVTIRQLPTHAESAHVSASSTPSPPTPAP